MKQKIQAFNNIAFQTLQGPEPKMFGTREENGVSTPHVLSMRSCAHTQAKHAKKDFISKHTILPLQGLNAKSCKSYQSTNMFTISTSNTYPNIL